MFGSEILEVVIGIVFIYLLLSIMCSALREGIESYFKTRAAYLEYGIRELLHDRTGDGIAKNFFKHPLINSLFSGEYQKGENKKPALIANGRKLPSYIPSKNFALALMDIAARGAETDVVSSDPNAPLISLQSIRMNIVNIENIHVQRALLTAIDTAQGDLNRVQANLEAWYDSAMDRVSGWYKRSTQWVIFWIALVLAVGLNVNTITMADYLYRNDVARAVIVARAEAVARDSSFRSADYALAKKELESMNLPIGWSAWGAPRRIGEPGSGGIWNNIFGPILGLLLTAIAATMGAPFWFDMLNKIMVIRSTVKPHEKSPEEDSEDRQKPKPDQLRSTPAETDTVSRVVITQPATPLWNPLPTPRDAESSVDGCHVVAEVFTSDEDLPPSEGGIA